MWINVDDVINFHGLKPKHLHLEQNNTTKLNEIITTWILQSQDLINMYTNRNYTDENVRPAIQNICLRITSNMVSLAIRKRDNPIIKVNDWTIKTLPSDILTDEIKQELEPFVKDASTEPNSIGVLAITGEHKKW